MDRDDTAEDVKAISTLVKHVIGTTSIPFSESLKRSFNPDPEASGKASEILEVGEFKGRDVYSYFQNHGLKGPPDMLMATVTFVLEDGITPIDLAAKLRQVSFLAPFKYIRPHNSRPLSIDAPLKAFISACFVLLGHTQDNPLRPRSTVNSAIRQALLDIERGSAEKGKREVSVDTQEVASRVTTSSTSQSVVSPGPGRGRYRQAIKEILWEKCGTGNLPYLNRLERTPTITKGADEKLQIGNLKGHPVFAFFDRRASPPNQVNVFQEVGNGDKQLVMKTTMHSVAYLKPYSFLEIKDQGTARAQKLRAFLKGCFALRGHSDGQLVSIDLEFFANTV
ncbi:hypothetical protein CC86DRAFT_403735 [Ophiobolus disseminans]|uniref:Uncharacterized protein n=1 Tax=Ophiobolus disseminans TaxID=1469910 RepID=A0A6A7A715_9PLEO|nr:hypothetical protein CC86DRAFT_403735 [Ophiobolus disseminans]